MVDISSKGDVVREAVAEGRIYLRKETLERIKRGEVEKGDVISLSKLVGIVGAKKTPDLLPFCHPIPITHADVDVEVRDDHVLVRTRVKAVAKTGVEMEALTSAVLTLLNIWDMVKKYEKDEEGQYPLTRIEGVRVIKKVKGSEV